MTGYRGNLWRLYLFEGLMSLHFLGGVLVPFFTDWGGIRYSQILLLQSIFSVSVTLFEIPTGLFADRCGRKASLALSALITAASAVLYSSRPHFGFFVAGEILWALGGALMSGADQALLYDSLKAEGLEARSTHFLGRVSSISLVALTAAAPVGSMIGAALGLRYAVMLMSVPMLLAMIAALSLREPPRGTGNGANRVRATSWSMLRKGLKLIRDRREVRWLVTEQLTVSTPAFFIVWTYQLRLKEFGIPLALYGWVHAALCGTQILILHHLSRLERLAGGKERFLLFSALVPALSFLTLGFSDRLAVNIAAMCLISGLGLSRRTLVNSYLHGHIESDIRATAMSTVNMISRGLLVVIYPLVGLGAEHSLPGVFLALGGLMLVSRLFVRPPARQLSG